MVLLNRVKNAALVTMLIVLLTTITWGCSILIADMGVRGPEMAKTGVYGYGPEITETGVYVYGSDDTRFIRTRAEVRNLFGSADETDSCPDGRVAEHRWIRQKIRPSGSFLGGDVLLRAYIQSLGLIDIFFVPVELYRSERAKLHYAFVYDTEDRVLYTYDLKASAPERFNYVMAFLSDGLYAKLRDGECDVWTGCLTEYAQEARQRAACVEYTLTPEEEEKFDRMFAIGEAVDAGRISCEEGMADFAFLKSDPPPSPIR